jgi:hypothetical protein
VKRGPDPADAHDGRAKVGDIYLTDANIHAGAKYMDQPMTTYVIVIFTAIGLIGLFPRRRWMRIVHGIDRSHNDIVVFYFAAITVFHGITLGLLAVGTLTTYTDVEARVEQEAIALGSLYRSVGSYPDSMTGSRSTCGESALVQNCLQHTDKASFANAD